VPRHPGGITRDHLIAACGEEDLKPESQLPMPGGQDVSYKSGFTFDFRLSLSDISAGQQLFTAKTDQGFEIVLQTADYGSVEILIRDGDKEERWNSDPGLLNAYGDHSVTVTVDNGPKIIQFVVDGTVCNGRDFRQYGWTRFTTDLSGLTFTEIETGEPIRTGQRYGKLNKLRVYNRALMNTEIIGNHRYNK